MSDGISYSEELFYQQRELADRWRKKAVNAAILLHVAVFAAAVYLPDFMEHKPLLDEVMTIDLVSMPEPVEAQTAPPVKKVQPVQPPEPEPVRPRPEVEQAVPLEISEPVETPEPAPEVKARPISLKPLKRKIRKARDTRLEEEKLAEKKAAERKRRQQAAERARKKAIAEARREEERAREAARRARAELAAVLREQQTLQATGLTSQKGNRSRQVNSAIEKQYYMDLARRVQRLWVLPEIRKWSPSLETIIEFTVLPDGRLVNVTVAKSSGDVFFDRFARDTVRKAAPMPPFPAVLRKKRLDLGFRLRPAGVQR